MSSSYFFLNFLCIFLFSTHFLKFKRVDLLVSEDYLMQTALLQVEWIEPDSTESNQAPFHLTETLD